MISKAFIEENGNNQMEPEMRDVYEELRHRGIPVELFTAKRVQRRQLRVSNDSLVVGYVETVLTVLNLLGIEPPTTNDYPRALQPFLHRRIWGSTVAHLTDHIYSGENPVFAKPQDRKKRFTGRVFSRPDDLQYLEGASRSTPVICSEVVEWLCEYRIYVMTGNIVGIRHYDGDPTVRLDEVVATEAVRLIEQSGEATSGYAIDLGVISTGQTALIEWNDGYALGSYELDKAVYTDLLIARWCELTGC